jgi:hypothetical protein
MSSKRFPGTGFSEEVTIVMMRIFFKALSAKKAD